MIVHCFQMKQPHNQILNIWLWLSWEILSLVIWVGSSLQVGIAVSSCSSRCECCDLSKVLAHPNTGPVRFLSPVRFFARKVEWSARRIFTSVLFSWPHQTTGPARLDTAVHMVHLWFGKMIRRTPRVPRTGIARAPQGNLQCFSYPTGPVRGPLRDPQGCRTTPLWTRKGIDTTKIDKNPARAWYLAVRGPYGLRTGCSLVV